MDLCGSSIACSVLALLGLGCVDSLTLPFCLTLSIWLTLPPPLSGALLSLARHLPRRLTLSLALASPTSTTLGEQRATEHYQN